MSRLNHSQQFKLQLYSITHLEVFLFINLATQVTGEHYMVQQESPL